ncbi:MAG TPA: zinc-dependent metalloprotease family protein [Pyrinomonadaceae bacterium]
MQKKLSLYIVLILAINLLVAGMVSAQSAASGVWQQIDDAALQQRTSLPRQIVPRFYSTYQLDKTALRQVLSSAPKEFSSAARQGEEIILTIPMPNGGVSRFRIENSSIMEPALAAKYPEIQSYRGQGIDNPTETVRFDMSPNGFRAMILSNEGTIYVEPYAWGDTKNYISFYKADMSRSNNQWACMTENEILQQTETINFLPAAAPEVTNGTTLKTYRLAMATTGEYTNVFRQAGDSDAQAKVRALAAINTSMNRVNQVYERDVSVRMVLIANTDLLIYTNGATDPYTNNDGEAMLPQNQSNIDSVIGTANYDIGHVFSTGGGGVATLNAPCGTSKAQGVTGLPNPVGDGFDIDFVAHEMGHQFGARHTFNGATDNCAPPNRSAGNSYEPGSGISIMAYAGICGGQNLALHSIDTFHVRSLEAIVGFVTTGNGNTCAASTATGNTPPTVSPVGGTSWNIPKQTPFTLTATGSDANGDSLTFDWQQYDTGGSTGTTAIPNSDADGVARPLFRPFLPTTGGARTFPRLTNILNNANVPPNTTGGFLTGELLPAISRAMTFQVVARDNRSGGGGINTATVTVNVDGNSGPFAITAPNAAATWNGASTQTVTWNVANTSGAPVNAANVRISLSTDGGQTFPTTLIESTPNDGTENITVPNINTTQARIKVEAVGNIFFDISAPNITINQTVVTTEAPFDFDGDGKTDLAVFRPSDTVWYLLRSQAGFTATQFGISTDKTVAADYDGDNKADIAVWRPATGTWYRLNSSNGTFVGAQFGANGDIPQPADFDGDGKDDLAVWRPTDGAWYRINSGNGQFLATQFGANGDRPVAADYDGDAKADLAVFRPSNGTWYRINSASGVFSGVSFGVASDKVVPGDYDGDNKTDIAVWRPTDGTWYMYTANSALLVVQFGANGDVPAPGDYDGDGKDDQAVYRSGVWYLNRSQAGFTGVQFGINTDQPINGR